MVFYSIEFPEDMKQAFEMFVICAILTLILTVGILSLLIYAKWDNSEAQWLNDYTQVTAVVTDRGWINPPFIFERENYSVNPDFTFDDNIWIELTYEYDGSIYAVTREWQGARGQEINIWVSKANPWQIETVRTPVTFSLWFFVPTAFSAFITLMYLSNWLIIQRKHKPIVLHPQASTWGESELMIELSFNKYNILADAKKRAKQTAVAMTVIAGILFVVWFMWSSNIEGHIERLPVNISIFLGFYALLMLSSIREFKISKKIENYMPEKLTLYKDRILFDEKEFHFRDIKKIRIDNPDYINSLNSTALWADIIICEEYETSHFVFKDKAGIVGSDVSSRAAYNNFCIALELAFSGRMDSASKIYLL